VARIEEVCSAEARRGARVFVEAEASRTAGARGGSRNSGQEKREGKNGRGTTTLYR
jgi:hypothetical protein